MTMTSFVAGLAGVARPQVGGGGRNEDTPVVRVRPRGRMAATSLRILATVAVPAGVVLGALWCAPWSPAAVEAEKPATVDPVADGEEPADVAWLRITHRDDAPELGPAGDEVSALLVGPSGDLWVRSDGGLSRLHDGRFQPIGRQQGLPHDQVVDFAATAAGVVVATPGGMAFIDELGPPDRPASVLCTGPVRSLAVHDGEIWFLVRETGAQRKLFRRALDAAGRPADLAEEPRPLDCGSSTNAITVDRRIHRVFPAVPGSLFALDGEADLVHYQSRDGSLLADGILSSDEALLGIHSDGERAWVLTSGRMLAFTGATAKPLPVEVDLGAAEELRLLAGGREGHLRIGSRGELREVDPGSREILRRVRLPADVEPRGLAEDLRGRIWVATGRGLLVNDPRSRVVPLPAVAEDAAAHPAEYAARTVNAAGFDDAGRLWLGGDGWIVFPEAGDGGECSEIPVEAVVLDASFANQALVVTTAGVLQLDGCEPARLLLAAKERDTEELRRLESGDTLLQELQQNPAIFAKLRARADEEEVSLEQLERRDRLLNWMLEHRDDPGISAALMLESAVLAAFEDEAVLRLGSGGDKEVRLWRAGGSDTGVELPWSIFTDEVVQAVPGPVTGGLMALTEDENFLTFDDQLKARNLRAPVESPKSAAEPRYDPFFPIPIRRGFISGDFQKGVVFWRGPKLWRWGGHEWTTEAELRPLPDARILGILPDPRGSGALIGCWRCGEANLYRAAEDGTVFPLPFAGDKVGCGNNALLRDSRGRVWISTEADLYVGQTDGSGLKPVRDANGNVFAAHLNALIEFPEGSGKIWGAAAGQRGVWRIEDGQPPRQMLEAEATGVALLGTRKGPLVGGNGYLKLLNPNTGDVLRDYWNDVVAHATHPGSDNLSVGGLSPDGDGILVLTNGGMVRIAPDGAARIPMTGTWPSGLGSDCCEMRVLHDQSIAVTARHARGTSLWLRAAGSSDFAKIADTPARFHSMAVDANESLLLGTEGGRIYALEQSQLTLRWDVFKHAGALMGSSFAGVCALAPTRTLVLGEHTVLIESGMITATLPLNSEPWTQCTPLSEVRALLLHSDCVSVLDLSQPGRETLERAAFDPPEERPASTHQLVQMARDWEITEGYAWLLGERLIWVYSSEEAVFRRLIEIPPRLWTASSELRMAVDEDGIWLATRESGVWRWSGDPRRANAGGDPGTWTNWAHSDGLPSANVRAVVPRGRGEAVIFTSGGTAHARRRSAGDWSFERVRQDGILGQEVHAVALFRVDGAAGSKVVALGTEKGVTLGLLKQGEDDAQVSQWWHLDRNDGLEGDVRSLHWSEAKQELWIDTERELTVIRLGLEAGPPVRLSFSEVAKLREVDLSGGPITEIRVSAGGEEAWLVAGHRIIRWRPVDGELVRSEPFFFGSAQARLGPAIEGRVPELLVWDLEGPPVLWDLGQEARPRLEVSHWLFLIRARLVVDRFTAPEAGDHWSARFVLDRLPGDGPGTKEPWLTVDPDLFRLPRPHSVVARVTGQGTGAGYVLVEPVAEIHFGAWLARLAIPLLAFGTGVGLTIRYRRRRRARRDRVRIKEVPYVAGKAVRAKQFFGREALIRKLCDTVAENNYALVGRFRIGKSSILHHLAWCLERRQSPRYAFFTLYVDLSHLRREPAAWDRHFFHFLGQNLIRFARARNGAQEIPAQLAARHSEDPAYYASPQLVSDLGIVLDHLRRECAPREPILILQLDEAALMHRLSYPSLLDFRAVFAGVKNVRVILSGKTIPDDDAGGMSPWRSFLREIIEVRPLTPEEAHELIVEPARGLFDFEHGTVDQIIGRARGQPMVLQNLCTNVVRYMYEEGGSRQRITHEDFEASLRWAGNDIFDPIEGGAAGFVTSETPGRRSKANRRWWVRKEMAMSRFVVGNPVRHPYFYDRSEELEAVLSQRWTWICGQRRMGKTSLLFRLRSAAEERGWIPLFLSLAHISAGQAGGEVLFDKLLAANRRGSLRPYKLRSTDFDPGDAVDRFGQLVMRLNEEGKEVIILLDEAERLIDVEENDPGFLERLRGILHDVDRVRFVLAACQGLSELFDRETRCSPFLSAFLYRPLGPLPARSARSLLAAEQTGDWDPPLGDGLLDRAVAWCGGHPLMLQKLGALIEEKSTHRRPSDQLLDECFQEMASDQGLRGIIDDDFALLIPCQQAVLKAACESEEAVDHAGVAAATGYEPKEIEHAARTLASFGYVEPGDPIRLRFLFYRLMLPATASRTNAKKVLRIPSPRVFISYSHADREWLEELDRFLKPVVGGDLDLWDDRRIEAGEKWQAEIHRAVDGAGAALLLISSEFLTSRFITEVELPALLQGRCRILCLHVRPSALGAELPPGANPQLQLLAGFQALSNPGKPLSSLPKPEREKLLAGLATQISRHLCEDHEG